LLIHRRGNQGLRSKRVLQRGRDASFLLNVTANISIGMNGIFWQLLGWAKEIDLRPATETAEFRRIIRRRNRSDKSVPVTTKLPHLPFWGHKLDTSDTKTKYARPWRNASAGTSLKIIRTNLCQTAILLTGVAPASQRW
jgi:hypothetical protein